MVKSVFLAGAVFLGAVTGADAAVFVEIERISDETARFTASGALEADAFFETIPFAFVEFFDLLASGSVGISGVYGGDLALDGTSITGFGIPVRPSFFLDSQRTFSDGDLFTGSGVVTLTGATWAPVGTTSGLALNDADAVSITIGSYEVVAAVPIPLPGAGLAMIAGLGGLAALRGARRRRALPG